MRQVQLKSFCSVCNVRLSKKNRAAGKKTTCKPCYNAQMREYYQKHKDRHRELMYSWRERNKKKVQEMQKRYAEKHFGSYSACSTYYISKTRDELTDGYVRRLLYVNDPHLKHTDITPELIEIKRSQIILKRQIQPYGKNQNTKRN